MSSPSSLPQPTLDTVRRARTEFQAAIEPLRSKLHGYCRRLTGDVWDAEDLVQETLARAFAHAAQTFQPVERPMAWLVRIATNAYLDEQRRRLPVPAELADHAGPAQADPMEVRDALTEVSRMLSPQERACLVLKDVFDLPLKEIAAMLSTSEGAVKTALHRGRSRLGEPDRWLNPPRHESPDPKVLDRLAEAFSAYDLERLARLFLDDAVSEVVGVVHEVGREGIHAGSLHHTLVIESDVRYRAEVREVDGELLVLLWDTPVDGSAGEALADVLRVETADGGVARARWYYYCPEVLAEIAGRLDVPLRTHGYAI